MSDVGEKTDEDFRFLFQRLEKGMRGKKEKLKNPVCLWSGCARKSFPNVKCLYSHVCMAIQHQWIVYMFLCERTVAKSSAKKSPSPLHT